MLDLIATKKGSIWHVIENVTKTKDGIFSDPTVLICFDFATRTCVTLGVWHYLIAGFPVMYTHITIHVLDHVHWASRITGWSPHRLSMTWPGIVWL